MSYVLAFLGFAVLIILHEAGHFAAAKAVGMRVERFSLFFGPMLVKFRRGETEYGIGPIPLGGYVKITGMNPNEDIPRGVLPRAYFNQPVWKRVVVILAGPVVNLVIAFALLFGIFLHQGTVATSHGRPVLAVGGPLRAPASSSLKVKDLIVAVDGRRDLTAAQVSQAIAGHRCPGAQAAGCRAQSPVRMTVRRSGQLRTLSIVPRYETAVHRTLIGFEIGYLPQAVGPAGAAGTSLSQMWSVTRTTVTRIATLFEPKVRQQLHGVVGGFKVAQQQFAFNAIEALFTLALISLSLAVVNLFPFLPLDGGHVFWAVAEKVRGRRISYSTLERAGVVGFVLIMALFVIGFSNDISTLTGRGFSTH